jgi:hypothetical protein
MLVRILEAATRKKKNIKINWDEKRDIFTPSCGSTGVAGGIFE